MSRGFTRLCCANTAEWIDVLLAVDGGIILMQGAGRVDVDDQKNQT